MFGPTVKFNKFMNIKINWRYKDTSTLQVHTGKPLNVTGRENS